MSAPDAEFLDRALAVAREAAAAAEEVVARHYRAQIEVEIKADDSPVTIADREAEQAIRAVLRTHFPEHAFYGEEYGRSGEGRFLWLIDPIEPARRCAAGQRKSCKTGAAGKECAARGNDNG